MADRFYEDTNATEWVEAYLRAKTGDQVEDAATLISYFANAFAVAAAKQRTEDYRKLTGKSFVEYEMERLGIS